MNSKTKVLSNKIFALLLAGVILIPQLGCGTDTESTKTVTKSSSSAEESSTVAIKGSRDNTPVCLVPIASGETVYENEYAVLDASNTSDGYVIVKYIGSSHKVKLQITGPDEVTYTYNLSVDEPKDEVFPLPAGDGEYMVNVYENIEGTQYSMVFTRPIQVTLTNPLSPFLYPNQYVNFTKDNLAIEKGSELCYSCESDLDAVSAVYNYIIENIDYDYEEAETVQSGYIPDIDEVLTTQKGICLDYAVLMSSILRSQRIPTRMEVGYAGTAYHAWLSAYIEDIGWVNGIIEFDGNEWSLMDPTFASNTDEKELKSFIGDGTNYTVKYIY